MAALLTLWSRLLQVVINVCDWPHWSRHDEDES
jgi:hypothetical protein